LGRRRCSAGGAMRTPSSEGAALRMRSSDGAMEDGLGALPGVLMIRALGCGIGSGTGMKVSPGAAIADDIPAAHATVRTKARAVPAFMLDRSLRIVC
jgi:hypothetical protein